MNLPEKIVITGASGWIGRSMISTLIERFGPSIISKIECFGSKERTIQLSNNNSIFVRSMIEIPKNQRIDYFIPVAFATQDKFNFLGLKQYESLNNYLMKIHLSTMEKNEIVNLLHFSSGIVSHPHYSGMLPSYATYKKMKKQEEVWFAEKSNLIGAKHIFTRLFSITGTEIQDPSKYAIGSLISQAVNLRKIHIESGHKVFRKYVDIMEVCNLMLELSIKGTNSSFDSTGECVEIFDLAKMIANILEIDETQITRPTSSSNVVDKYYSDHTHMEDLFRIHDLKLSDMNSQLLKMIKVFTKY